MENGENVTTIKGHVKYRSEKTFGIFVEELNEWVNMDSQNNELKKLQLVEQVKKLKNGSELELVLTNEGKYIDFRVLKEPEQTHQEMTDGVSLKELLSSAHKGEVTSIATEVIYINYEKQIAHVKALVCMPGTSMGNPFQKVFTGHACKRAEDMTEQQRKYWLETIESQAIARALRWATNTGTVSKVEVENQEEDSDEKQKEDVE